MRYLVVGEGRFHVRTEQVEASTPEEAARTFDGGNLDGGTIRVFRPDDGVTFDVDVEVSVSVRERTAAA